MSIYDDHGGVQPPSSYTVQYFAEGQWRDTKNQVKTPPTPIGSAVNTVTFAHVSTQTIRVVFTHRGESRSGLTEIEVWKE